MTKKKRRAWKMFVRLLMPCCTWFIQIVAMPSFSIKRRASADGIACAARKDG
jgi:hypothetical protein